MDGCGPALYKLPVLVGSSQSARPQQLTDSRIDQSPPSGLSHGLRYLWMTDPPPPVFPVQHTDGRTLHRAHARAQTRSPCTSPSDQVCARPGAWSAGRRRHCSFLGRKRINQELQRSTDRHVHNTCTFVYKYQPNEQKQQQMLQVQSEAAPLSFSVY